MEKDISLNLTAEVGDSLLDNRDKTYFKITAINRDSRIALGYRYSSDAHLQSVAQQERSREADIISLMDLVMHFKKATVKFE